MIKGAVGGNFSSLPKTLRATLDRSSPNQSTLGPAIELIDWGVPLAQTLSLSISALGLYIFEITKCCVSRYLSLKTWKIELERNRASSG
jgi:hypothetical protein